MRNAQLYLASVKWREPGAVADISPGKMAVPVAFDTTAQRFEASIPAYARDHGRDMQLAVKSLIPCVIIDAAGVAIPMTEHVHADTGDHWWIEEGPWVARGRYHDAPSFHRPHGDVVIRTGDEECVIHLYDPGLSDADFDLLLDDIKNWCWRMAIDESCYVTVPGNAEVRMLSPEFLRIAEDFIRNVDVLLQLPHCELREAVEVQRMERLRPNTHSLRFLAQRGDQRMVPGRSAVQHYDTPENRFVRAMLRRILSMLRWTVTAAQDRALRFERMATQYDARAKDLHEHTSERIDPRVLDENLRRSRSKRDALQLLLASGYEQVQVTSKCGDHYPHCYVGYRNGTNWTLVDPEDNAHGLREAVAKWGRVRVVGRVAQTGWISRLADVQSVEVWRDYARECETLERKRADIEQKGWQTELRPDILQERRAEADTLVKRSRKLRKAGAATRNDSEIADVLLVKACGAERKASRLGITPDLRFVPTMVFLQAPPYAGALSAYRQLLSMTGVDDAILEGLLALENVGLRDWPTVYERWCLVSLLRVLQDDFRFVFDTDTVRANLLRHCTGQKPGSFVAKARRKDMTLELELEYQAKLSNGRTPDFLLTINDTARGQTIRCVLDAKSCAFQHRPADTTPDPWRYLDDCLDELVNRKNYGENGANHVFIMHSVNRCGCAKCANDSHESHSPHPVERDTIADQPIANPTNKATFVAKLLKFLDPIANAKSNVNDNGQHTELLRQRGPITQPTTLQSWANASAYGGDVVFSWETAKPEHRTGAVMVRPEAALPDLRRLVLMLIQFGLDRHDICASCGAGGTAIAVTTDTTEGGATKLLCRCTKCQFLSVKTRCYNCKKPLFKNQAWWSYHDLHPTDVWNNKCWACGSLL